MGRGWKGGKGIAEENGSGVGRREGSNSEGYIVRIELRRAGDE